MTAAVDRAMFRASMARLGAAVSIVTTDGVLGRYGATVSAVCSITDKPPTILVCLNRASRCNVVARAHGVLCVNILAGRHAALSARFAEPRLAVDARFGADGLWTVLATGAPVLADAVAALDCRVAAINEVGTHSMFLCEASAIRMADDAEALIWFDRNYYHLPSQMGAA